jgi:hypothetical protein
MQLERKALGAILHLNAEIGMLRYGHLTRYYWSTRSAVEAYLKNSDTPYGIDGIPIDWNA